MTSFLLHFSKIAGVARAVVLHEPPRDVGADQFHHADASALGDGLEHRGVLVVEPDLLVVPARLAETVLPPIVP